jgi:hypothetical protein
VLGALACCKEGQHHCPDVHRRVEVSVATAAAGGTGRSSSELVELNDWTLVTACTGLLAQRALLPASALK